MFAVMLPPLKSEVRCKDTLFPCNFHHFVAKFSEKLKIWFIVIHKTINKKGVKPNLSKIPLQFSLRWQDVSQMFCPVLP